MDEDIDCEVLIYLVEERPVLWDETLDSFKDRVLTRNAWREVCRALKANFEDLEDNENNAFGKDVVRRWTNLRDAFVKSKSKLKDSKKSGSGRKTTKKYVFNDQLQFLNKIYEHHRDTVDSLHDDGSAEVEEDETVPQRANGESEGATNTTTDEANKRATATPARARKHRIPDEIELRIMKALESEKPDNKMTFFNSLLPHLDSFDNNDFLQFQMGVLQLIANINEKKKMVAQPPQMYPQPTFITTHTHQFSAPSAPFFSHPPQPPVQARFNPSQFPLTDQPHSLSSHPLPFSATTTTTVSSQLPNTSGMKPRYYQDVSQSSGVTSPESDSRDTSHSQYSSTAESLDFFPYKRTV